MGSTACGGGDTGSGDAVWQAPPAAPTSAAPQEGKKAGTAAGTDKELCEAVDRADTILTGQMVQAMQGGGEGPSASDIQQGLKEFAEALRSASDGSDSEVAKAMQKVAADSQKIAQSADPAVEAAKPAFEEANTILEKACQAAGVKIKL
ncbi:hypothetical protein ACFY1S_15460 [Micromonospora sp. NPDC000663]|uniref:hypothetical protein n=1 Tax=Micromonospora sp. NPDC000663 TaxID=3364218 RepID=UPI0036C0AB6C